MFRKHEGQHKIETAWVVLFANLTPLVPLSSNGLATPHQWCDPDCATTLKSIKHETYQAPFQDWSYWHGFWVIPNDSFQLIKQPSTRLVVGCKTEKLGFITRWWIDSWIRNWNHLFVFVTYRLLMNVSFILLNI